MMNRARFVVSACAIAAFGLAGCANDQTKESDVKSIGDLPNQSQSMLHLGDVSRAAGDCTAAIRFYRMVVDKNDERKDRVAAMIGIADCELAAGDRPSAERDYREAAGLAPDDPMPLVGLGRVALVGHNPADAAAKLDAAIAKGATGSYVWNDKGVALDQLGRHKQAQAAYREGLGKYPADPSLADNLALSLAVSGDLVEAERILRGLVQEPAASARTRQNLALVLGLEGEDAEAREVAHADLDGAAIDNNLHFYQYARAALMGAPLPAALAATPKPVPAAVAVETHAPPAKKEPKIEKAALAAPPAPSTPAPAAKATATPPANTATAATAAPPKSAPPAHPARKPVSLLASAPVAATQAIAASPSLAPVASSEAQ
jgi:Flp pilus assembly protein TadD